MCQNVQIISELGPAVNSTHSQPTKRDPDPGVMRGGVCTYDFSGRFPKDEPFSFSTIAALTQSSSRGYPIPVANKNTQKEDVYI